MRGTENFGFVVPEALLWGVSDPRRDTRPQKCSVPIKCFFFGEHLSPHLGVPAALAFHKKNGKWDSV
ncbi:hypothetical protein MPNT_50105 [Candidatus Methylacidithermus pantelleriae]|uniref:Uncharacterized protein n=1 Tax=Candidatus Methylacidithermus pantelleriae TaxID=2744239 RepID=A0A8J2BRU4_9BACT|nr:hypothetical protein MPNT_50105 [Candidatus Methylacidithermus pantelleriae]